MLEPVPYTIEAVMRIRNNALTRPVKDIAFILSWTDERVKRVAHTHGISVYEKITSVLDIKKDNSDLLRQEHGPVLLVNENSTVEEIEKSLPFRQGQVFKALHSYGRECYMYSRDFSAMFDVLINLNIARNMRSLKERLKPTKWEIDVITTKLYKERTHSGYKLVERVGK